MKYYFFLIFLLVLPFYSFSQNENIEVKELEHDAVYIVCRATTAKIGVIATDFNISDTLITHIGLGLFADGELVIYNVSMNKISKLGSSLIKESVYEFKNIEDIAYFSIWKKNISKNHLNSIINNIEKYENRVISFDYDFELNEKDSSLYCSEFIYFLLKKSGVFKESNLPRLKRLKGMYKNILGEKFKYIPVDFFQLDNKFEKIFQEKSTN